MLEFKIASAVIATASASLAAYKTVPKHATSNMSSGLDRLFGTPTSSRTLSRDSSASSIPGQRQVWEESTAEKRRRMRAMETVQRELDEYLDDPLETFSRAEQVGGAEKRVIFDLLAFWQVRLAPISCGLF